ncbi:MAG: hypothetical protein HYW86_05335 [Candidatus Roizmanbacteria bacterium]|nr:MAG: hypothetical protein HYW86_05335 [Candidatus Roizmanbacteria bacterium]
MENLSGFEKYKAQYGTIELPQQKIEVVPTTSDWLIAKERTWEEVDNVIEGHLQGIQSQFIFEDGKPTNIAKKYGFERPPGGNMARFLAYVELSDEYSSVREAYQLRSNSFHEAYENEKDEMKKKGMKPTRVSREAQAIWAAKYNPQVLANQQKAQEAEKIQDLILRKAVLDIFSVENNGTDTGNPLITEGFPKIVEELMGQPDQKQPANQFLSALTSYLKRTKDQGLFIRYKYRKSPNLVTKIEDCKVLDACLEQALDSESLVVNPETASVLSDLGQAYFKFLRQRLAQTSGLITVDKYPHASLLYDTFLAATYRGKPNVISEVSQLVDDNYADLMLSPEAKREITIISNKSLQFEFEMHNAFENNPNLLRLDPSSTDVFNQLPQEFFQYLTAEERRLDNGLYLLHSRDKTFAEKDLKKSTAVANLVRFQPNLPIKSTQEKITFVIIGERIKRFIDVLPISYLQQKGGIEITLGELFRDIIRIKDGPISILEVIKDCQNIASSGNGHDTSFKANRITNQYFIHLVSLDSLKEKDPKKVDQENAFLWQEILDKPEWFVSPRRDRYSKKNDPEQENYGMESISFSIDKTKPREHKCVIRLNGLTFPLEYWISTDRKIFTADHLPLPLDTKTQTLVANILLKRLYLITSGLLSKEQVESNGEENGTRNIQYKRAHYRTLHSTLHRPITMESHGAIVHAKEIKEIYGIDIWAEMKRRRALGTLKPNEFLTFVKETEPKTVVTRSIMPNELRYIPELVQIP